VIGWFPCVCFRGIPVPYHFVVQCPIPHLLSSHNTFDNIFVLFRGIFRFVTPFGRYRNVWSTHPFLRRESAADRFGGKMRISPFHGMRRRCGRHSIRGSEVLQFSLLEEQSVARVLQNLKGAIYLSFELRIHATVVYFLPTQTQSPDDTSLFFSQME
jgi:hypothetical protein